jgi:hypothetical protein
MIKIDIIPNIDTYQVTKNLRFAIIILLLSGCASTTQYVKFSSKDFNKETNAKIYVMRPTEFGFSIKMRIFQDEKLIGKLGPKSYLSWEVNPEDGDIIIISKSENKDMLTISPKKGKTYYIKQKVKMGWAFARTGLEFLEEKEAIKILDDLKKPKMKYTE